MKKFIYLSISKNWWLLALLIIALLIGLPMLFLWWDFADDSLILDFSANLSDAWQRRDWVQVITAVADLGSGRIRVGYWLWHWLPFEIFGPNPYFHRLIYLFLMIGTTLGVAILAKRISNSSIAAFLAGIFFVTAIPNIWTWYRMGFAEAPLVFLVVIVLLFLIESFRLWEKKKTLSRILYGFSLIFSILIYSLKESGIVFVGIASSLLLLFWFSKNKAFKNLRLPLVVFFLVNILVAAANWLFFLKFGPKGGYGFGNYFTTTNLWSHIKVNFLGYAKVVEEAFSPFWLVLLATFIISLLPLLSKRTLSWYHIWNLVMLVLFFGVWAVYEPWGDQWNVYLSPAFVGLSVFAGCEITRLISWAGKQIQFKFKYWPRFSLLVLIIVGFIGNLLPIRFSVSFHLQPEKLAFLLLIILILFWYFFKNGFNKVPIFIKRFSVIFSGKTQKSIMFFLPQVIMVSIIIVALLQILNNSYKLSHFIAELMAREKSNSQLFTWLSANIEPSSIVAMNLIQADRGFEYFNGFNRYFKNLLNRTDVEFVYLDLSKKQNLKEVDYVVSPNWQGVHAFTLKGTISSAWEKVARYEITKIESELSLEESSAVHSVVKSPHPLILSTSYPVHLFRTVGLSIFKNAPLTYDRLLPKFEYYYSWKVYKLI